MVLTLAVGAGAAKREKAKLITDPWLQNSKASVDTIFFDDFETDTMGWDTMDIAVQEPFWNINTYCPVGAFAGHHWWCGTDQFAGIWPVSPGYGNGWVQMLYSPDFDLTSILTDSVQLRFHHYYSVEPPGGGSDWDCVNLWASTDNGANWTLIRPDTLRSDGAGESDYNLFDSYAWHYTGLVPDSMPIAGWGGTNSGWSMVTFDLSPYKGQTVKLRFAVVSDPMESDENSAAGYHGAWYFDNLSVDTLSAGGGRASIFFDDCESGNLGWTPGSKIPAIHWHKTTYRANSPVQSWYCGDENTRLHSWGYSDAIVSPLIDLRPVQTVQPCRADFKFWADMPDTGGDANGIFDNYSVDVSLDSGYSWQGVTPYVYVAYPQVSQQWIGHQEAMGYLDLNNFVGQVIKLRIAISTDGDLTVGEGLYVDDFIVTGKTREPLPPPSTVLLVDNDGNAVDLNLESWTKYIESSLAGLGYRYSLVTIGTNKELVPGYMEQYPAVIWNLGGDFDGRLPDYKPISASNRQLLMDYLDSGGNLWISGQKYLGFGNPDTSIHPNLWSDYLHLSPANGWWNSATYRVAGVPGDPIGDGFSDTLDYMRLNGASVGWTFPWFAYSLSPDTPAVPVSGFMMADDGSFNGLRHQDAGSGYKLVHTSFPFEALSSWQSRDTLLSRVLGWFLGDTLDYLPPQVPAGLTVQQDSNAVICTWRAGSDPDLAGYHVYRAVESGLPVWAMAGTVAAPDTVFSDTTIIADTVYAYAVTAFDQCQPANESLFSDWAFIRVAPWDKTGSAGGPGGRPVPFALHQNAPNPARGVTAVRFSLPEACRVELTVYNILGQSVATLARGAMGPGGHSVSWNARDASGRALSSGCYFYRIEAVSQNSGRRYDQTRNMVILP
jgi:hypothetical protein